VFKRKINFKTPARSRIRWNGILNGGTFIKELYRSTSVRISAILEMRIYFEEKGSSSVYKNLLNLQPPK